MGRVWMIWDRGILSVVERARFHRGIVDAAVNVVPDYAVRMSTHQGDSAGPASEHLTFVGWCDGDRLVYEMRFHRG